MLDFQSLSNRYHTIAFCRCEQSLGVSLLVD